ncbi:hypothetical protein Bca4012_057396 [Brassica carinata]
MDSDGFLMTHESKEVPSAATCSTKSKIKLRPPFVYPFIPRELFVRSMAVGIGELICRASVLRRINHFNTSKMKQGDSSVREYNSSFLAAGLLDNHDQRMLVNMYRDGLKEDIRVALGSTDFSTIDDIMHAALDIEEGGRSCS